MLRVNPLTWTWRARALGIILLLAGVLRFYRISEYMRFLGDEGRDARVVYRLITQADLVFVGPMTSVTTKAGHMYLGPIYYYLMAPFMAVWRGSPVGAAVMVASLSLLTTYLIYQVARQWWSQSAGLVAALLYAVNPLVVQYSRSSWNPNVMPLFALLSIWSIVNFWQKQKFVIKRFDWHAWLVLAGLSWGIALQSHYLGLLLLPVMGTVYLLSLWQRKKINWQQEWLWLTGAVLVWLSLQIPLFLFDWKHDWRNWRALADFFTDRQTTVNLNLINTGDRIGRMISLIGRQLWPGTSGVKLLLLAIGLVVSVKQLWGKLRFRQAEAGVLAVWLWLLFGIVGLAMYKQTVFDHYYGFLYPAPVLLLAFTVDKLWHWSSFWPQMSCYPRAKAAVGWLIVLLAVFGWLSQPYFRQPPEKQWQKTQAVADLIIKQSQGQPFNLALLAEHNYDEGYRFALEYRHAPLVEIDPTRPETITEQLFVVCEDTDCQPIANPQSEIALFGWARVDQQWQLPWGVQVFLLKHTTPTGKRAD